MLLRQVLVACRKLPELPCFGPSILLSCCKAAPSLYCEPTLDESQVGNFNAAHYARYAVLVQQSARTQSHPRARERTPFPSASK